MDKDLNILLVELKDSFNFLLTIPPNSNSILKTLSPKFMKTAISKLSTPQVPPNTSMP